MPKLGLQNLPELSREKWSVEAAAIQRFQTKASKPKTTHRAGTSMCRNLQIGHHCASWGVAVTSSTQLNQGDHGQQISNQWRRGDDRAIGLSQGNRQPRKVHYNWVFSSVCVCVCVCLSVCLAVCLSVCLCVSLTSDGLFFCFFLFKVIIPTDGDEKGDSIDLIQ